MPKELQNLSDQWIRVILLLLVIPLFSPAAHSEEPPGATPPAPANPAKIPSDQESEHCVCLRHTASDNVEKNCTRQQRAMEDRPRLLCLNADGIKAERKNLKGWEILPADHADCAPCEDDSPVDNPHVPRGNETKSHESRPKQ